MTDDEFDAVAREVLTPRQLEVWRLYTRGLSQRDIALALRIDRATVRHHLEAATRRISADTEGDAS